MFKAMAFKKISVYTEYGIADKNSYIAAGDWCTIYDPDEKTGLWRVDYPIKGGTKTRWLIRLTGFLCNQYNYGDVPYVVDGYPNATIRTGGCGICAAVNAVGAVSGKMVDIITMRKLAYQSGARVPGGTQEGTLLDFIADQYKFKWQKSNSRAELEAWVKDGGVAICNVAGNGMFSDSGHYITILGVRDDGRAVIADSGLYKPKYTKSVKRRNKIVVSGDIIFAEFGVVEDDCIGRNPRYYLIKKK